MREISAGKQMRETIDDARRKIQRFADLARRAAPAITDHIRGHRCAMFAIAAINFLNHRFTAIATGKIEIDVRPAFAALVQKTFEDKMIFDGIDRSDPQAITDRAVGRATSALDHDIVFATEIDDVPDDQKIPGEPKLRDKDKFFLDLAFHFWSDGGITLLCAEPDDGAQKRIHRVPGRHRIFRKFVAEIFERKRQPLGEARSVFDRFW